MYLDVLVGGQEMWGGVVFKVGCKFVQVVVFEGFFLEFYFGILMVFGELFCEYWWLSWFIFMDQYEVVKYFDKFCKKWWQKICGFFDQVFNMNIGLVDQDVFLMVVDVEVVIVEVNSGIVVVGYYISVVVLMDEDCMCLEVVVCDVEKVVNWLGFVVCIEFINILDVFFGSLLGYGVENVCWLFINMMNLVDLLLISIIWIGNVNVLCLMYLLLLLVFMYCVM